MSVEVSGLVIAKNEARDLPNCLSAWSEVCDQLLVVNDQSSDATPQIARTFGATVLDTCMDEKSGFAGLRNTGLEAVQTSHVLVFDADELPTPRLLQSIQDAVKANREGVAYRVQRRNSAFGGWLDHGRFTPDWQTRLFSSEVRYVGHVHEIPDLGPHTEVADLEGKIEHRTYLDLDEYRAKIRFYAEKQAAHSEPQTVIRMLGLPVYYFVAKQGYKDGWRGAALAVGDGWHDHLVRKYYRKHQRTAATAPQSFPALRGLS